MGEVVNVPDCADVDKDNVGGRIRRWNDADLGLLQDASEVPSVLVLRDVVARAFEPQSRGMLVHELSNVLGQLDYMQGQLVGLLFLKGLAPLFRR